MARFVVISRNETGPVVDAFGSDIAPDFSHYEFWGGKDTRNRTGNTHELSESVVRAFQAIRTWANNINPEVGVEVTSTYRTPTYQRTVIKNGVSNSTHSKKLAGDGKFVPIEGSSASASEIRKEMIAEYNTDIRDKGPLFQQLRSLGIAGFGLYGPGAETGAYDFFHIDARETGPFTDKDGVQENFGGDYSIWTRGEPRYIEEEEVEEEEEPKDTSGAQIADIEEDGVYDYVIKGDDPYTFNELVQNPDFLGYGADPEALLRYKHLGVTNHKRLWNTLPEWQQIQLFPDGYSADLDLPLVRGAVVFIPINEVGLTKPASSGNQPVVDNKLTTYEHGGNFLDEERATLGEFFPYILKRLTLDPGYVPVYRSRGMDAKSVIPQITAYIWSRTLFEQGETGWIDVTKDIISCTLHDDMNGGNLQMTLAPVMGVYGMIQQGETILDEDVVASKWEKVGEIVEGTSQTIQTRANYYRRESGKTDVAVEHLANDLYYERVINQNDMIFISFEQLQFEDQRDLEFEPDISGKWFDMMALVDVCNEEISSTGDSSVIVRATDFTKALINDRSYFSPYSIGHASSTFGGNVGSNGRYLNGEFVEFAVFNARTIREQIEFVTHRLASIGYVPDEVFDHILNKTEITTYKKVGSDVVEEKKAKGIWQLFKLFIDTKVEDMTLADMSLTNPQGSILELMKGICQEPFVQFMTQTIGDKFYLIARRAPFDQETYRELVTSVIPNYDFTATGDGTLSGGADEESANVYRQYLEELEAKRAQSDSGDPDSEYNDGNQIHVNSEQNTTTSTDTSEYVSLSESEQLTILQTTDEVTVETTQFPLIINIGAEDIERVSLQMENQSYAWYQIENTGDFLGKSQGLGYIPAIYFDEYAQVFGNERLRITSNYTNFQYLQYEDRETDYGTIAQHTARLLAFLVETHIYLPFTRRGTITLKVGDRRIKKGNFIYYRPTREVYYVDSVDHQLRVHNQGIERTTTVQVSRGMVLDFITPEIVEIEGESVEVSYFNIVDLPKIKEDLEGVALRGTQTERIDYKADFAVNEKVLNFFLSNNQFRRL